MSLPTSETPPHDPAAAAAQGAGAKPGPTVVTRLGMGHRNDRQSHATRGWAPGAPPAAALGPSQAPGSCLGGARQDTQRKVPNTREQGDRKQPGPPLLSPSPPQSIQTRRSPRKPQRKGCSPKIFPFLTSQYTSGSSGLTRFSSAHPHAEYQGRPTRPRRRAPLSVSGDSWERRYWRNQRGVCCPCLQRRRRGTGTRTRRGWGEPQQTPPLQLLVILVTNCPGN